MASDGPHPLVILDNVERELERQLTACDDLEALALLRYAVVLDRGVAALSLSPAPPASAVYRMSDDVRGQLADALRRAANAIAPPGRRWEVLKVDVDTFYVHRGDYRLGPYLETVATSVQSTLNMLDAQEA